MKIHFVIANLILVFAIQNCIAQKNEILSQPYRSSLSRATVKDFLDEINTKTGLIIEYSSNNLQLEKMIEPEGKETSIGLLLQKVLKDQKVKLVEKNHKLILAPSSTPVNPDHLVASYIIFGFIKEGEGKEPLIEATISESGNQKMIITNTHGYYSLSLPEGAHQLQVTYTGYTPKMIDMSLHSNTRMDFEMSPNASLQEVLVTSANHPNKDGAEKIPGDLNDAYNYFLGENDPIVPFYGFPGVLNVPENFSSMLVRGGGPDENLFLLEVPRFIILRICSVPFRLLIRLPSKACDFLKVISLQDSAAPFPLSSMYIPRTVICVNGMVKPMPESCLVHLPWKDRLSKIKQPLWAHSGIAGLHRSWVPIRIV